jgi:hypothetical protein
MADIIVAGIVGFTLLFVPVLWRVAVDHAVERASILRAQVNTAVRGALGGDSLVSVDVRPTGITHRGQVILSVPAGWGQLVEHSLHDVMAQVPDRYDLVIRAGAGSEAKVA